MANPFAAIVGQRRAQSLLNRGSKTDVSLGPWPRGVVNKNTGPFRDQLDTVPDGALSHALNLDIQEDGSLLARRGFQELIMATSPSTNVFSVILCVITRNYADYALVATYTVAVTPTLTWVTLDVNGNLTTSSAGVIPNAPVVSNRVSSAVLYNDRIYILSNNSTGFQSSAVSASGGGAALVWTNIPNIPIGVYSLVIKDRLFVVNSNRISYSKATDFTTWAAPDGGFFDVDPDPTVVINSVIYFHDVLYIFKSTGLWVFTFTSDPAVDGYLRKVSNFSFRDGILHRGKIYAITKTNLYEVSGTNIVKLNNTFNLSSSYLAFLAGLDDLLLVGDSSYYQVQTSASNSDPYGMPVYNTRTGTWTFYDNHLINAQSYDNTNLSLSINCQHRSVEIASVNFKVVLFTNMYLDTSGGAVVSNLIYGGFVVVTLTQDVLTNDLKQLDYKAFLSTTTPYTKPAYIFQTRKLKLAENRYFKVLYPFIEWVYKPSTEPVLANPITRLKLTRSTKPGEVGTVLGGQTGLLSAAGIEFAVTNTNTLEPMGIVEGGPGLSSRFRTLSTIGQFYQQPYSAATIPYFGNIRIHIKNIILKCSFPEGQWSNTSGKIAG